MTNVFSLHSLSALPLCPSLLSAFADLSALLLAAQRRQPQDKYAHVIHGFTEYTCTIAFRLICAADSRGALAYRYAWQEAALTTTKFITNKKHRAEVKRQVARIRDLRCVDDYRNAVRLLEELYTADQEPDFSGWFSKIYGSMSGVVWYAIWACSGCYLSCTYLPVHVHTRVSLCAANAT